MIVAPGPDGTVTFQRHAGVGPSGNVLNIGEGIDLDGGQARGICCVAQLPAVIPAPSPNPAVGGQGHAVIVTRGDLDDSWRYGSSENDLNRCSSIVSASSVA